MYVYIYICVHIYICVYIYTQYTLGTLRPRRFQPSCNESPPSSAVRGAGDPPTHRDDHGRVGDTCHGGADFGAVSRSLDHLKQVVQVGEIGIDIYIYVIIHIYNHI